MTVPKDFSRYAHLRSTCEAAYKAAWEAAEQGDDGGTCNLDAVLVCLPRWQSRPLLDELERLPYLNVSAYRAHHAGAGCWIFNFRCGGQAARRTRAQEAATTVLIEAGYACRTWYVID